MAKKTRTELSTLAVNTNLPDNTSEQITPTTERAQLTEERDSVINYKDDLGGTSNAGKFLTVGADGESLTMVDEPSGVPDWVTFATAVNNLMMLKSGTNSAQIQYFNADGTTLGSKIVYNQTSQTLFLQNNASGNSEEVQVGGGILLRTGGTTRLTVISGGNVGIGITSPTSYNSAGNNLVVGSTTNNNNGITIVSPSGGSANDSRGNIYFADATNDTSGFITYKHRSDAEQMLIGVADSVKLTINSSGIVGIGSTGIYAGTNAILNLEGSGIALKNDRNGSNNNWSYIQNDGTGNEATIILSTGNANPAMKLAHNGNVGIGTTSPDFSLDIEKNGGGVQLQLGRTGTSVGSAWMGADSNGFHLGVGSYGSNNSVSSPNGITISTIGDVRIGRAKTSTSRQLELFKQSGDTSDYYIICENVNQNKFLVSGAGTIFAVNTTVQSSSDARLKENIRVLDTGLNEILNLKPRRFDWKKDEGLNIKNDIGFVAQEVEEILPELVMDYPKTNNENTQYKSLGMSKMIPTLVKAIQEQQTIIEDLKARIEKLEL